jgi:hypothetical protein
MATGIKWPATVHPTGGTMPNSSQSADGAIANEESVYDKAKERYEEAKEAYQVALEDLANAHTEAENTQRAMIEAREAFLVVLGNDKIEEDN